MENGKRYRAWGINGQGAATDFYFGRTAKQARAELLAVWDKKGLKIYVEACPE
jgi:hypothetical protein